MHSYYLNDLKLAGIKWELNEASNKPEQAVKNDPITHTKSNSKSPNKIPPIAPVNINDINIESVKNISDLSNYISEFKHPLRAFAKNVILPKCINGQGGLLIITDIPSSDDDSNGQILTGKTGELMDKMLNAIELDRDSVSICPLLFWATPGGRSATVEEINLARPFLDKLISLLKPDAILTLGTVAAKQIADIQLPKDHGKTVIKDNTPITAIFHPNYLILKPNAKSDVWTALQNLQKTLKNQNK